MSVPRNLWRSCICTVGALIMGALPSTGLCQQASEQVDQNTPDEPIEEIVVYGEKPLGGLRRELYKTEENFFAMFNSLNEDEEYDVQCSYEVPSFTHIRKHVCKANFMKDATAADYAGWRRNQPVVAANTVIMQKKRRLGKKMEAMAAEHPELFVALGEYSDAKQILESEKKKCRGKSLICRR